MFVERETIVKTIEAVRKDIQKVAESLIEKVSAPMGNFFSYYHQSRDRERSYSRSETNRKDKLKERHYSEKMEEGIKYLEETVATLTVSIYTLQGQLLDMRDEMNDNKEESDELSTDNSTITNDCMSSVLNESISSVTESTESPLEV